MASVRQQIPSDWIAKTAKRDSDGTILMNPSNTHDRVRIMPGKPHSPNPAQNNPYVIRQKNGMFYDKDGNVVSGKSPEAHIPIDDFKFRP